MADHNPMPGAEAGEVLSQVRACTICGSDPKIVQWNITVAGSQAESERSRAQALALLLGRRLVDLSPLPAHTFALDRNHAAFETAEQRLDGTIKVVVEPGA